MKSYKPKSYKRYVREQEAHHTSNHHEYPISPWHKNVYGTFKKYLKSPIVDIGCRNGILLDELEKDGYVAYGIELTDIAKFAQEKGRKVVQADIQEDTGFEDGFFKSAIMTHCIEHLYDPDSAMKEIRRIVDGYVFLAFPTHDLQIVNGKPKDTHYSAWTSIDDMEEYLKKQGFEIISKHSDGWASNEIIIKT